MIVKLFIVINISFGYYLFKALYILEFCLLKIYLIYALLLF